MELYAWLEKRGWKPDWHIEPQDSADFTIKQIQQYLRRLVQGEGNIADQVESRRKQLELANQLEEADEPSSELIDETEVMSSIEYEGDDDLEQELESDDTCLN